MLEELGATPDQVANTFRDLGIRGIRNTVRFLNPLVRYAHRRVEGAIAIDVILGDRLRMVSATGRSRLIEIPAPVLQFLEQFHQGAYPDLELPIGPEGAVEADPFLRSPTWGWRPG
jgi:hypothetical protein